MIDFVYLIRSLDTKSVLLKLIETKLTIYLVSLLLLDNVRISFEFCILGVLLVPTFEDRSVKVIEFILHKYNLTYNTSLSKIIRKERVY